MMKHLIPLSALLLAAPALAQSALADLSAIDAAVARFAGAPLGAPGGAAAPVDRRLRLGIAARCRLRNPWGRHR